MGKGTYNDLNLSRTPIRWFFLLTICSQIIGITAFILIMILFGKYCGGFGWGSDLNKVFNNHPIFMVLGMILFYGDAILAYRTFPNIRKFRIKILHACLLALSLLFSSIGLIAIFINHNRSVPPEANLTSIHAWLGIIVIILFACQWIFGFISFLYPGLNDNIRKLYMSSHRFWGKLIFSFGVTVTLMGIAEYSAIAKFNDDNTLMTQRYLMNFSGLFIVIFAVIILYLVNHSDFERPVDNEMEHIPLTN